MFTSDLYKTAIPCNIMKTFTYALLTIVGLAVTNACTTTELPEPATTQTVGNARKGNKELSRKEIDAYIEQAIAKKSGGGLTRPIYDWGEDFILKRICGANCEDDLLDFVQVVWSTTKYAGPTIRLGYQIPGWDVVGMPKINLNEPAWQDARQQVLTTAFAIEKNYNKGLKTPEDLIVRKEEGAPDFDINITQLETFVKLTKSGLIRYFVPFNYEYKAPKK
jgi:hypothetical protein